MSRSWCIWADKRFKLGHGRAFALYVAAYTVGRAWIESLRVDYAHHILGLRLNDWTALIVFLAAVAYFVLSARYRPGREAVVDPARRRRGGRHRERRERQGRRGRRRRAEPADRDAGARSAEQIRPSRVGGADPADPEAAEEPEEARSQASEEPTETG